MQSRWKELAELDDLGIRVHTSRLLGSEKDLVLHGGGNTSVKVEEKDHTGKKVPILRIKGSGSDLSKITRKDFTGLRMVDLLSAKKIRKMDDLQMMDYMRKSMLDPLEPSPSVEAFLHAFIPFKFVDHTHADSIISLTNTDIKDADLREALGNVVVLPYVQPGFSLATAISARLDDIVKSEGIVLRNHGLFTFSDDAQKSYAKHIELVTRAEEMLKKRLKLPLFTHKFESLELNIRVLPALRGLLSQYRKKVLCVNTEEEAVEISCSAEAEDLCTFGPATPDMLIRTKGSFLYIAELENMGKRIKEFAEAYYLEQYKYASAYPMHDPFPCVIVLRGMGIISASTTMREARIIMDDAMHSFKVSAQCAKLGKHAAISKQEMYAMEYWPLQEAKLRRFAPKKFQGTVAIVSGAAGGIGLEAFRTLAENGSHVVALDIDNEVVKQGKKLQDETGVENLAIPTDLGNEDQITAAIERAVKKFGGIDVVFNNAGILKTAPLDAISTSDMDAMYRVNSRGTFIVTREAFRIMKEQGIGGSFVFNVTKNLTNPGAEMTMYGATKAFAAQLSHYVAKEGGKYKIRSNIINPDKVFRGSRIWEDGVLESRAKAKGQTVEEYKTQNLLGIEVLPEHVVGVLMALIDDSAFGATTDAMIPVDGGIK